MVIFEWVQRFYPFSNGFCNTTAMTDWTDRARVRMKETGITQERLAQNCGLTTSAIQKWLAGDRQPTLEQINHIADVLNVTHTWLTYGLDSGCTTDGLAETPRRILSKLILLEREGRLRPEHWSAIEAISIAFSSLEQQQSVEL